MSVSQPITAVISALFVLTASHAQADPATVGFELIFENPQTLKAFNDRYHKYETLKKNAPDLSDTPFQRPTRDGEHVEAVRLKEAILGACPECALRTHEGKFSLDEYEIMFPGGFWINIGCDPGKVEVQVKFGDLNEWEKLADLVQSRVYDVAATPGLDLIPPTSITDNHVSFGTRSVLDSSFQLLDLEVDEANHPELSLGVLGESLLNAPPLAVYEDRRVWKLARLASILRHAKPDGEPGFQSIAAKIMLNIHYTDFKGRGGQAARHYQALNIEDLLDPKIDLPGGDRRFEYRGIQTQPTFRRLLLAARLKHVRIQYVKRHPGVLSRDWTPAQAKGLTPSQKLSRFYIYVTEMGESFETYRELVPDVEIRDAALDAFVRGGKDRLGLGLRAAFHYVPDLQASEWVRERMAGLLAETRLSGWTRERLIRAIERERDAAATLEQHEILTEFLARAEVRQSRGWLDADRAAEPGSAIADPCAALFSASLRTGRI